MNKSRSLTLSKTRAAFLSRLFLFIRAPAILIAAVNLSFEESDTLFEHANAQCKHPSCLAVSQAGGRPFVFNLRPSDRTYSQADRRIKTGSSTRILGLPLNARLSWTASRCFGASFVVEVISRTFRYYGSGVSHWWGTVPVPRPSRVGRPFFKRFEPFSCLRNRRTHSHLGFAVWETAPMVGAVFPANQH